MPKGGQLRIRVVGDASGLKKSLDKAGRNVSNFGKSMARTGSTMTKGLTLPIVGAAAGVIKMASDFKGAMNQVQAVTQPTEKEMAALEKTAKRLGRTTQFSASEAASGLKFLGQAGLNASQQMEALPSMLDLAAAGSLDLGRAADIATDITAGFGLKVSEMGRVNDVLAETASSATTDVEMLSETMKLVAPVAKSSGISLEEMSAAAGVLANSGIKASQAGTQLRGIIAKMEAPTKQQKKVMRELGVSFTDAQGNTVGLIEAVGRMKEAGADTGDIMQIFGRRAGTAMAALVEKGAPAIEKFEGKLQGAQGRAKEMAETQMQGLPGAIKRLKSAFEGAALAIADSGVVDMFANVAERVTALFRRISEANPALLKIGVIVAGVAAAIGPLLIVLGGAVAGFGALLPVLAALTGPVGLIIAGLAAVAAGFAAAYAKSEQFRGAVNSVVSAVSSAVKLIVTGDFTRKIGEALGVNEDSDLVANLLGFRDTVMRVFRAARKIVGQAVDWFSRFGDSSSEQTKTAIAAFQRARKIISSAVDAIVAIVKFAVATAEAIWRTWGRTIIRFLRETWRNIQQVFEGALNVVEGVFETFAGLFTGDWGRMWDGIKQILSGVWQAIHGIIDQAFALVRGLFSVFRRVITSVWSDLWGALKRKAKADLDAVVGFFSSLPGWARDALVAAWQALARVWQSSFAAVKDFASARLNDVVGFVASLPGRAKGALSAAWGAWSGFWSSVWSKAKEFVASALTSVATWFAELPGRLVSAAGQLGGVLAGFAFRQMMMMFGHIKDVGESILTYFREFPGNVVDGLGNLGELLVEAGKDLLGGLASGVKAAVGTLGSALKSAVTSAANAVPFVDIKGDGPGFRAPSVPGGGGSAMSRAQAAMAAVPGPQRITSAFRTPAENRRVGGSPTSYHLDETNPAVDIGGVNLNAVFETLRKMGGHRELLGPPNDAQHQDHVHVAHRGGFVTPRGIEPLRSDELLAKLQHGETVLEDGATIPRGSGGHTTIRVDVHGSLIHERDLVEQLGERLTGQIRRKTGMRD